MAQSAAHHGSRDRRRLVMSFASTTRPRSTAKVVARGEGRDIQIGSEWCFPREFDQQLTGAAVGSGPRTFTVKYPEESGRRPFGREGRCVPCEVHALSVQGCLPALMMTSRKIRGVQYSGRAAGASSRTDWRSARKSREMEECAAIAAAARSAPNDVRSTARDDRRRSRCDDRRDATGVAARLGRLAHDKIACTSASVCITISTRKPISR
jgi:hypothetical protein